MKKIAIAACAVCLIGLGAFAKVKFFAQTDGSYIPTGGGCVTVDFGSAQLEPLQSGNNALTIKERTGSTTHQIYLGSFCNTSAPAQLIP